MLHAMIEEPLFDLSQDIVYLNHAAVAPWPRAASEAVTAFAAENAHRGAASYPAWLEMEASLRERLRTLINAPSSDDIALLKSTSEGLSFIAQGLPWEAGDNIVIPAAEFPSNRMVWQTLEALGVQLREIDIITAEDPEAALIAAMDERTRLLSCSSVQYAYGLRLDLARIGEACRDSDTLFCVDAIQSLGALRFDLEEIGADFVVADGHKWMTGPEGLALFYCKPDLRERLKLTEFGWHMMDNPHDFKQPDWRPADSAKRFECGSPNMLGAVALNAALSVLLEVGMQRIEQAVLDNSGYLIEKLSAVEGVKVLTPLERQRRAGIVLFSVHGMDSMALYERLMDQGVVCANRGTGVRWSPHFHTTHDDMDRAVQILTACL